LAVETDESLIFHRQFFIDGSILHSPQKLSAVKTALSNKTHR
jgi:hypothetical protein